MSDLSQVPFEFSPEERRELLRLARQSIFSWVCNRERIDPGALTGNLANPAGAFVTLEKNGQLRGCIGTIYAVEPVAQAVIRNAIASATGDPRFSEVRPEEIPELSIEISVLSPLEPISSIEEIEVGVHGLLLTSGINRGLLLPQVATEYGWDRKQFLEHTARKAGLPPTAWKHAQILRFCALVFGEEDN